jgi:hypothetical protein
MIATLTHAAPCMQDIEALAVGEKSKEKLQEILQTGRLRRNDVLEGSELHRTLQLFMT